MSKMLRPWLVTLGAVILSACGGTGTSTSAYNTSTSPGTPVYNPPFRLASIDAVTLAQKAGLTPAGLALLALAGQPLCGIDVYYLKFATTGGAGEATQSSGALMVPTGLPPACRGPRPVVEYAHGTQEVQSANIADITDPNNSEGLLIAVMFAAQGYIVAAPNYAGYDISTLGYHPYLNAAQQSAEMIDMLSAARAVLPHTFTPNTTDNGQLFLTGYSQGGYVAMATQRALQAAGKTVTAAAPLSGPYALEAFTDAVFYGSVNLGSTVFTPLVVNSYQNAYGNVDSSANPVFSSTYASAATLLPGATSIDAVFAAGLLPKTELFNSTTPVVTIPGDPVTSAFLTAVLTVPPNIGNPPQAATPVFQAGFGDPYLVNNDYRVSYVLDAASNPDGAVPKALPGVPLAIKGEPTQGLRQDFWLNDMRNDVAGDGKGWTPAAPVQMCGGNADPTVFYSVNTQTMAAFWNGVPTVLPPVDVSGTPSGPYKDIQAAFQDNEAKQLQAYIDAGLTPQAAANKLVVSYHGDVAPFCALVARSFFAQF